MKRLISVFALSLGLAVAAVSGTAQAASETQIASVDGLPIEVTTSCVRGDAVFKVVNTGDDMAKAIMFTMFYTVDSSAISKRRMKLIAGQAATFKVRNANEIFGHIGFFMGDKVYQSHNVAHATLRCSS